MPRSKIISLAGTLLRLICLVSLLAFTGAGGDVPPIIVQGPENGDVYLRCKESDDVIILKCNATGSPQPTYEWYKNGVRLDGSGQTFQIPPASFSGVRDTHTCDVNKSREHEGQYRCLARNKVGVAISNTTSVKLPCIERVATESAPVETDADGNVAVSCKYIRCQPQHACTYSWQQESRRRWERAPWLVTEDGTMIIRKATDRQLRMAYRCDVRNSLMTDSLSGPEIVIVRGTGSYTSPLYMLHQSRPTNQIVEVGQNIRLDCIFNISSVKVEWTHNGERIHPQPEGSLSLISVNRTDQGNYTCRATSSHYSQSVTFLLHVLERPKVIEAPVSQAVWPGSDISFRCRGEGNPDVISQWFINDQNIQGTHMTQFNWSLTNQNSTLTLHNLADNHAGVVNCKLNNSVGQVVVGATFIASSDIVTTSSTTATTLPTTTTTSKATTTTKSAVKTTRAVPATATTRTAFTRTKGSTTTANSVTDSTLAKNGTGSQKPVAATLPRNTVIITDTTSIMRTSWNKGGDVPNRPSPPENSSPQVDAPAPPLRVTNTTQQSTTPEPPGDETVGNYVQQLRLTTGLVVVLSVVTLGIFIVSAILLGIRCFLKTRRKKRKKKKVPTATLR